MDDVNGKILIIDDNEDVLFAAELFLKQHNFIVHTANHPARIPPMIENEGYDVILLDMNYQQGVTDGTEGFVWLSKILEIDPEAIVILITAYGDIEMAVKAIRLGATDYIQKPWENERLLTTIKFGLKLKRSYDEKNKLQQQQKLLTSDINQDFEDIIGNCQAMQQVFSMIKKVAKTDANVLILGENGTGKELVARALHRESRRKDEIFMNVDMGAITESLFESELFGHIEGAFTDAKKKRIGRMEAASGGSLFLDEIGNLSTPLQAKLLKVLESREITPVGSNKVKPIDIRLICATNMPLDEMVNNQEFRQDLLYRINTVVIKLPPLRERVEDIPILLNHFILYFCKKYKHPVKTISPSFMNDLIGYKWPGNIRELKHIVERAVIMSDSDILENQHYLIPPPPRPVPIPEENRPLPDDEGTLEKMEKAVIIRALIENGNNKTKTAKKLGLSRTSLHRRLKKFGLIQQDE